MNIDKLLKDRFNNLLIALVIIFFSMPFVTDFKTPFPFISLLYLSVLLIAIKPFVFRKRLKVFYLVVAVGALILDWIYRANIYPANEMIINKCAISLHITFLISVVIQLSRELFYRKEVEADAIKGGICIYILTGILWSFIYSFISVCNYSAFIPPIETGHHAFFFSFTTLTTLGYGDIVPISNSARILTSMEAVGGQLFLAIFIARLIGLYIVQEYSKAK